jgi:hypothetical protein
VKKKIVKQMNPFLFSHISYGRGEKSIIWFQVYKKKIDYVMCVRSDSGL